MRRWMLAGAVIVMLALPHAAFAAVKHVLVLNAYGPGIAFAHTLEQGLTSVAAEAGAEHVEVYWEALEAYRFAGDAHTEAMRSYLREKYSGRTIDAIIAAPDTALAFLLQVRSELFPGVPIVALMTGRPPHQPPAGVTELWVGPVYAQIAALAQRLRPGTRRLLVVEGSLSNSGAIEREIREQLAGAAGITLEYLRDLPLADVLARVARADVTTSVLFIRQLIVNRTESIDNLDALQKISSITPVPIYGATDLTVGRGAVGGYVTDIEQAGALLMKTALAILNGEIVARTSTLNAVPNFDWRELARWHIAESRLPAGSVVRFRQLTSWQQYRRLVLGALFVVIAQAVLIAALLLHRARRRRAELALRASEAALRASCEQSQHLAGRLISAQEAERRRIARDLHDDLSQKLALLNIGIDQLAAEPEALADRVRELSDQAGDIAGQVHRLSHELHPSKLEVLGLVSSVRSACSEVTRQYGVHVQFRHQRMTTKVPPEVALCLYRIVQESLHNVVKHSGAREASVRLAARGNHLHLHVADRGTGFDAVGPSAGLGLVSMRERAHHVGGRIAIRSSRAHGTRIAVHVPLRSKPTAMRAGDAGSRTA